MLAAITVIDFLQEFQDYNMMPAVTDYFQFPNMSMPRFVFSMDQNHK